MRDDSTRSRPTAAANVRTNSSDFAAASSAHASANAPTVEARTRLAHLLIAKSIVEALLVSAFAVAFYYLAFNPHFRGSVDEASAQRVSGWVTDESRPAEHIEVQLYINGKFAASRLADEARPDIRTAGRAADERHGFTFLFPTREAGEHEARVYAVHASGGGARRTLQLVGRPLRFTVGAGAQESNDR
ncbi:MAG TPA: hypothetical protein VGV59_15415 [Pyrinomonadaceae bacterium]|nr:hypothetical protein [Pyrinomonadaceae bacterium]